jgi:hypothetical protein
LQRLSIPTLVDRPGVGRNLQNHPYLHFALTVPPRTRLRAELLRFGIAGIRLSSGLDRCPTADLLVFLIGRVSPRSFGTDLAMVGAALYAPYSRGAVTLARPDIEVPPRIAFALLQDPRDPPRLLKAARYAESLLLEPAVAETYRDAFLLPPVMSLNQFNRAGLAGALLAGAAKAVLNAPAPLCRWALNRALTPGRWFANRHRRSTLSDDEILSAAAPMAHVNGDLRDRAPRRSDGGGRPELSRLRCREPEGGRCVRDAERAQRQHQSTDHHGRGTRRRPDPRKSRRGKLDGVCPVAPSPPSREPSHDAARNKQRD